MKRENYWVHALMLIALSALAQSALALTCTATTAAPQPRNWNTAATWTGCNNKFPQNGDAVIIPNGSTVTLNANTRALASLAVNAGGTLQGDNSGNGWLLDLSGAPGNLTNNGTITLVDQDIDIAGNFVNNGSFNAGTGVVTFLGPATQAISGTSPTTFADLDVSAGAITLGNNVTVTGALTGPVTLTSTCPVDYTLTAGAQVWHSCLGGASGMNHVVVGVPATPSCGINAVTITPHTYLHATLAAAGTIYLTDGGPGPPNGNWSLISGAGTFTVTGGVNSGTATYTFGATEISVTLGYTPTGGPAALDVQTSSAQSLINFTESTSCINNGNNGFGCDITPAAGFIVTDVNGNPIVVPPPVAGQGALLAGQTSGPFYLKAVNKNCGNLYNNKTRTLEFGMVCVNPLSGTKAVTLSNAAAPTCNANGAPPTWGIVANQKNVLFDANSLSPAMTLIYPDVGQIEVPMRDKNKITNTGTTGPFVVKPGGFVLSAIKQTAAPQLVNPAATNAVGAKFVRAGEAFTATVTVTTITGAAAPNFGKETAPTTKSVELQPSLVAGLGLVSNPSITGNFVPPFVNGAATGINFAWPEVGIITLLPHVLGSDYLGGGDSNCDPAKPGYSATLWCPSSGNVGRFYPDHFDTAVVATATIPMPCPTGLTCPTLFNGFVYSGQSFTTNVYARNVAGGTSVNYSGASGFSKQVTLSAWDALGSTTTQNPPATSPGSSVGNGVIAAASFSQGTTALGTPATPTYSLPNPYPSATPPPGPTDIYVRADESPGGDGVSSLRVSSVEGGVKVVSGRMKLSNAHGSELLQLPIAATIQYWNGTTYVTSTTDSVSSFASGAVSFTNCQKLSAISTWPTTCPPPPTSVSPASVVFLNGMGNFILAKPGVGKSGSVDMTTSAPSYLPSNKARATFGVYKGANEFIYLRENY